MKLNVAVATTFITGCRRALEDMAGDSVGGQLLIGLAAENTS